ncbi:MAG: hypothetical protein ACKO37_00455 [Vampirovibrionales bacterium]
MTYTLHASEWLTHVLLTKAYRFSADTWEYVAPLSPPEAVVETTSFPATQQENLMVHPLWVARPYELSTKHLLYRAKFDHREEASYHVARWLCEGYYALQTHYPEVTHWVPVVMPPRHAAQYTGASTLWQRFQWYFNALLQPPELLPDLLRSEVLQGLWSVLPYTTGGFPPLGLSPHVPLQWCILDTPLEAQHRLTDKSSRLSNRHASQLMCHPSFLPWLEQHLLSTSSQAHVGFWVLDDIYTTGATMQAMVTCLKKALASSRLTTQQGVTCSVHPWVGLYIPS